MLAFASFGLEKRKSMPQTSPNIMLIILDTLRRDHLSAYGYQRPTSPHLDEFSTSASVFDRAIAPAQWTIPSHASMFTGLYPGTHQLTQANGTLSGSYPTLAEILQVDGYHTVGFSNNPLVGVLNNGLTRGFSEFYNYSGAAPNRPVDQKRSRVRREVVRQFRRVAGRISNQVAQHDPLFRMSLNPLFFPALSRFVNYKGDTERSLDDLMDYWTNHQAGKAEKPLFAFINLMGAHTPYRPPQDYLKHIAPDLLNDRQSFAFINRFNGDPARWASPTEDPLTDWQQYALDAFYDAEIAHQDMQVGRLLAYLEKSGALDDTLVIIAADHGEGHGDHKFFGHGFVVYQELVHVPLMIHYPAYFPAKHIKTNVSTRRIFHTVLDFAGIQPPLATDDPNADVENLSLVRATNGRPDFEGGIAFAEAVPPTTFLHVMEHRDPSLIESLHLRQIRRGVYEGNHKLAMVGEGIEGLFDITQDPTETQDIARHHHEKVDSLKQKVGDFVVESTQRRADNGVHDGVSEDVVDNLRQLGYFE